MKTPFDEEWAWQTRRGKKPDEYLAGQRDGYLAAMQSDEVRALVVAGKLAIEMANIWVDDYSDSTFWEALETLGAALRPFEEE